MKCRCVALIGVGFIVVQGESLFRNLIQSAQRNLQTPSTMISWESFEQFGFLVDPKRSGNLNVIPFTSGIK